MLKKFLFILIMFIPISACATPISIVAAENFYGDVAQQIGGPYVQVSSIMKNPQQDPHLFSSTPNTAKDIAQAQIIIYNGLDYDPWMNNLIAANDQKNQHIIIVAKLLGRKNGDNPHIWYDPQTMLVFTNYLASQLSQIDPVHQNYYQQQLDIFKNKQYKLQKKIKQMRQQYHGAPVIATEPVFNDMAAALLLTMYGQSFQLSIMNDTTPSFADTKDFEDRLTHHLVKVLIYNNQVSNPLTEHLQTLAKEAGIPTVGVSETEPPDQQYFTWMNNQLEALENALASRPSP